MKTVLITGASSGIGRAAALRFIREGYAVYAAARRVGRMEDLRVQGIHTMYLDVTDEESCRTCVDEVLAREGQIDILVNNAGYGAYGPVETVDIAVAQAQLDVNLYGAVRMAQLAAPHMHRRHTGRIINISSAGGRVVTYLGGWYHAAKYALEAVSDAMRMELSGDGIDVVLIEPGGVTSAWGAITADNLSRAGKDSPYQGDCDAVAQIYRKMYAADNRLLTSPDKVAAKICRAAVARRPRARYLFGFGSRTLVFAHAVLPDRAYDRVMKAVFRSKLVRRLLSI